MGLFKVKRLLPFLMGAFFASVSFAGPERQSMRAEAIALLNEFYTPAISVGPKVKRPTLYGCRNYEVNIYTPDPVTHKFRKIELSIFNPAAKDGKKAILIVPPTGGENTIDRAYAYSFCRAGFEAVILSSWDHLDELDSINLRSQDFAMMRGVTAIRNAIDYVKKPVGIMGTSVGALFTSGALSIEPRLEAGFLIVGGAPVSEIFATSHQRSARRFRENQMIANRIATSEQYELALRAAMKIDLDILADENHKFALKMVIATSDGSVPTKTQMQLWEYWGRPDLIKIRGGHPNAVLHTYLNHRREVIGFFKRHLRP